MVLFENKDEDVQMNKDPKKKKIPKPQDNMLPLFVIFFIIQFQISLVIISSSHSEA